MRCNNNAMSPQCICIQLAKLDQSVPRIKCKVNSVLIFFSDFEILNKKETYLSWPSFQVENDLEIEFLF